MKLSLVLPSFLAASGIFAFVVGAEKAPATDSLRANAHQDARKTNEVSSDYWAAPIKSIGLTCIDNSIRAGGGKPNEICITEGEALCVEYDYKPMGGRWQFGIKDSKLRLYDPKQEVVYEYGTDVSHVCIGEEQGFDPNRYSKERPYMTLYNEKTHKVVGSLTCDSTDGKDDENIGQSTMLKLVDQADIGPYASYPLTIVKFKKGQTEDPEDDNSLWNIVVGDYPTDQPTDEPTMEPTMEPSFSGPTFEPTDEPTPFTPNPTYIPTAEPTFKPTGELSALYGIVNFNANKCEWITFVDTFQELQRRIAMATDSKNPAKIEISNIRPIVFEGIIDISNKYFEISCPDSDCVFDLNGYSFVTPDNGPGSPFHAEYTGMTIKNGSSRKGRDGDTYNTVFGGAFMLRGASSDVSSLVLTDSILRNNIATFDSGVIDNIRASITATDSIFENNESGGDGGVMWTDSDSTFERCRFEGNYADFGGALTFVDISRATITECEFHDNTSVISGGAIYFSGYQMVLEGCIFTTNSAEDEGGAIYTFALERTEIRGCSFEENEANFGGSIYTNFDYTEIVGTTFECNEAYGVGGAIYSNSGEIQLFESEFTSNTARGGGALVFWFVTDIRISSCLFDGNEGADIGAGAIAYLTSGNSTLIASDTVFQNNKSLNPNEPSDDILDFFYAQDIQCGSGFGNCFCDADTNPSVGMNITTNDLPTTCSGAGRGLDCPGCRQTVPVSCSSAISRAGAMTRSGINDFVGAEVFSSLMKDTDSTKLLADTPAGMMSETMMKAKEKMEEMNAKYLKKIGGR